MVPGFKSNVTSTLTPFTSTTTGNLTGSGVSVLGLASGMASSVTAAAHAKQTFSKNLISFKNGGGSRSSPQDDKAIGLMQDLLNGRSREAFPWLVMVAIH